MIEYGTLLADYETLRNNEEFKALHKRAKDNRNPLIEDEEKHEISAYGKHLIGMLQMLFNLLKISAKELKEEKEKCSQLNSEGDEKIAKLTKDLNDTKQLLTELLKVANEIANPKLESKVET